LKEKEKNMNVLRRIAMAIGGTVVVALVLALAVPRSAHAVFSALVTVVNTPKNPVPVQAAKESRVNFISVSFNPSGGSTTYNEVSPDGTISSTPFTIPAGEEFVITDVNWITVCGSDIVTSCTKSAGDAAVLVLGATNSGLPTGPYMSRSTYTGGTGFLTAGRSDSLKSGLVVAQLPMPSLLGASSNGEFILAVTLRGYLVP